MSPRPRETVSAPRAVRMKRMKVEWNWTLCSVCMYVLGFRAGGVHMLQALRAIPYTRNQFGPGCKNLTIPRAVS